MANFRVNEQDRRVLTSFTIRKATKELFIKSCRLKNVSASGIVNDLIEKYMMNN